MLRKCLLPEVRRRWHCIQFSRSCSAATAAPALAEWRKKLEEAGIMDTEFNLKCLLAHVKRAKFTAVPDQLEQILLTPMQHAEFQRLCEARCARMPLQYLLGEWDFCDITLKMLPTVFIPRPETEEFVQKLIAQLREREQVHMLEVGCGSGAISLAMLHALPQLQVTAIERSRTATALAAENAALLGLQQRFNVYNHTMTKEALLPAKIDAQQQYDWIVSNPPYVKTQEFQHLQPEVVVYENLNALDGGSDELKVARILLDLACVHLRSGGQLWLELGAEHPPLMKTIVNLHYESKLRFVNSYEDQYKRERFVQIEKI